MPNLKDRFTRACATVKSALSPNKNFASKRLLRDTTQIQLFVEWDRGIDRFVIRERTQNTNTGKKLDCYTLSYLENKEEIAKHIQDWEKQHIKERGFKPTKSQPLQPLFVRYPL